jgi:succinyl-diaminopimelate desuccinylase
VHERTELDVGELLSRIDAATVQDYAEQLVRRPSVNPPGDTTEPAAWVAEEMARIGLEVTVVTGKPDRPNVVGRLAGNGGRSGLCLSAHTDVVGVGDPARWGHDPFAADVVDGIMYGRGTADSKGMLAAMLVAARAIKESGVELASDLYVVAFVDDETAGEYGLRYVFDQAAVSAPFVIYGEATRFDIKRIYKSRLWFDVEVLGQSAHGAFPHRGVNAIDKAYDVIAAVRGIDLRDDPVVGPDTVNVGVIRGGDQVNKVCGECTVSFDIRWGPGRSSDEVYNLVVQALEGAKARDAQLELGPIVVTEQREPLSFGPDSPLVAATLAVGADLLGKDVGLDPGWLSSGDLYWLWKKEHMESGIVWGPGDPGQAHVIDEHISVADLVTASRAYAALAIRLCVDGRG